MSNALVGIIAEDDSDVECVKHFVRRIHTNKRIGFKKFVGQGCGKISRKANAWAKIFKMQGCTAIILLHDLDRNKHADLYKKLSEAFLPSPIRKYIISIPVEELESWLLSDENAFNSVFNINKTKYLPKHPETVPSPKEYIAKLVRSETNKKIDYLNTRHNSKLAEQIDFHEMRTKCPSSIPFMDFVKTI